MRGVRGWISGMMVSRVSLQALSKWPPYSNLLPYYFTERTSEGVASYPIHVPPGSANAKVNIVCIYNNRLLTKFDFCPYTVLSEMFF